MSRFDWNRRLSDIYSHFPEAEEKPVIGITGNYEGTACMLSEGYYKQVVRAGGVPVIVPPLADTDAIINTLRKLDGLILSGGSDYNPLFCGEEPSPRLHGINSERDLSELLITRLAYNRQIPMLGICRGIQTLAMALGGHVAQDIQTDIKHSQDADRSEPTHTVNLEKGSVLCGLYDNTNSIAVNSFHHQAIDRPGKRLRIAAKSPDGVIEAVESAEFKSVIGVQWHPECLGDDGLPLFEWIVKEARQFRLANNVHDNILTLDTHCDTPMFFPQNVDFSHRDPRILVDMHKMSEGRQDATVMVAYLPQPKIGETFSQQVAFPVSGPTEYADLIFDRIEDMVRKKAHYISIARTPADLYSDKRMRRKSVMLGIENGLALDGKLQNVKHFAQRGVVYITLCHNGDNDLCDSARGCNTHNGVSKFGEQVIMEMNRLGIIVDMSHAGEKSFYDALEISRLPIVCSHSSCRSLCDHPRNLTDGQMQAIAGKGGVVQITLYEGFLRKDGKATVLDAVAHLEHAISVMGIDHVGIGTDFDGDGGVCGFADSSEMINFTRRLLARRYSDNDIQKIWGGNFLRVMSQVQAVRSVEL